MLLSVRCVFQLTGGPSCDRRRAHYTKMNCFALQKNLGVTIFSASQADSIQEGIRPGPALSPWFHAHCCIRRYVLLPASPPRSRCGGDLWGWPLLQAGRFSRVFLHVHSAGLLPSLGPGPPGLAALVLCVGYKSVTPGAGGLSPPENVFLLLFAVATCRPSRPLTPVCGFRCVSPDTAFHWPPLLFGRPNSFWACHLDLWSDFTALWADRGHVVHSPWAPQSPTAHQANCVWAGQYSVNSHFEKLSLPITCVTPTDDKQWRHDKYSWNYWSHGREGNSFQSILNMVQFEPRWEGWSFTSGDGWNAPGTETSASKCGQTHAGQVSTPSPFDLELEW